MIAGCIRTPGSSGSGLTLTATITNNDLLGTGSGFTTVTTSMPAIVTPAGGVPPYAHAWTKVSGSSLINPNDTTASSNYFYATMSPSDITGVWQDSVSDSGGSTPVVVTVSIELISAPSGGQFS